MSSLIVSGNWMEERPREAEEVSSARGSHRCWWRDATGARSTEGARSRGQESSRVESYYGTKRSSTVRHSDAITNDREVHVEIIPFSEARAKFPTKVTPSRLRFQEADVFCGVTAKHNGRDERIAKCIIHVCESQRGPVVEVVVDGAGSLETPVKIRFRSDSSILGMELMMKRFEEAEFDVDEDDEKLMFNESAEGSLSD
ncbi:hypothetical protein BC829DRAFT_414329 [Chytridium lagenaria]|nr:hypothetical protein BC829DRAFT_414329 [Chytridium lagenaria]